MSTLLLSPAPVGSEVSIDRRRGLTRREFVAEYQRPRRPVILLDATSKWPARDWTPEQLSRRVGHRIVTIRTEAGAQQFRFDELVDLVLHSTEEFPAPYARNIDVERDLPELWEDIQPRLAFATPDWKSSPLLPRDFLFRNGLQELFFGGAGTSFPKLHIDYWGMDGFVNQLYGEKEFLLISNDQAENLYRDPEDELSSLIDDFHNPNLTRFPKFRHVRPLAFRLRPGETLYMPNGWWHTTTMREVSVTVITATWNRDNWGELVRQYRRRGNTGGFVKAAVLLYLTAVGCAHAVHERVARP